MRAILISIKPKWCALMMNGDKSVEVRKGTALYKATKKLIDEYGYAEFYVYCAKGKPNLWLPYEYDCFELDEASQPYLSDKPIVDIDTKMNGKVLFKFRCYNVEEIEYEYTYETETLIEKELCSKSCLTKQELHKYLFYKTSSAIHISNLEIFDRPKELSEFYGCCDNYAKNVNIFKNINGRYVAQYFNNPKCLKCKHYDGDNWCSKIEEPLTKAPQNWQFIETEN